MHDTRWTMRLAGGMALVLLPLGLACSWESASAVPPGGGQGGGGGAAACPAGQTRAAAAAPPSVATHV
ncbi:MAG: hypothetical protein HY744_06485 [Deltaproteobacteria bacterium]|nr:hypothetical protein [Deltaproteobacteria bacterium]